MKKKTKRLIQSSAVVDYGASSTKILLLNTVKKKVKFIKFPSKSLKDLPNTLKNKFLSHGLSIMDRLVIGARGVWLKHDKNKLLRLVQSLGKQVVVMSDIELAHLSAFNKNPGLTLIAGTGSIAYGRNPKGTISRAGGLGLSSGDPGSGYWIGKTWAQLNNNKLTKNQTVQSIASLSQTIIKKSKKRDPRCIRILDVAHHHLSQLVQELIIKLKVRKKIALECTGGLFKDKDFRRDFLKTLKETKSGKLVRVLKQQNEVSRLKKVLK